MSGTEEAGVVGAAPIVLVRTIRQTRVDLGLDPDTGLPLPKAEGGVKVPEYTGGTNPTGIGLVNSANHLEVLKYRKMWDLPEYRTIAPGEGAATRFLQTARPKAGSTVIDFGAGTGRGALMLAIMGNVRVEMLDFAANCLDEDVRNALTTQAHMLAFHEHDLTMRSQITAEYGYCTDVMEHIPPEQVDLVLQNILVAARHVYFQIACTDDSCGVMIGEKLHLSVHPHAWWLKKFQDLDCTVHYSLDEEHTASFYVSAWVDGETLKDAGILNVLEQAVIDNVKINIEGPWQNVVPHETNDMEVMILGGGPSLGQFAEQIKVMRAAGVKLVTLNGTYNWALEQGLSPSATVVVDAREFNHRFTHPVTDGCKYLISSQVHPKVLEGLPQERTYLWHQPTEYLREILNAKYPVWYQIPGGSTVMLRAIPLLRLLGFKKFHLFGFDSCLFESAHHAYSQPENDKDPAIDCFVEGRKFLCHPWMVSQAQEFMALVKFMGNEIDLEVYGDGLIAHIIKSGAEKADFLL